MSCIASLVAFHTCILHGLISCSVLAGVANGYDDDDDATTTCGWSGLRAAGRAASTEDGRRQEKTTSVQAHRKQFDITVTEFHS